MLNLFEGVTQRLSSNIDLLSSVYAWAGALSQSHLSRLNILRSGESSPRLPWEKLSRPTCPGSVINIYIMIILIQCCVHSSLIMIYKSLLYVCWSEREDTVNNKQAGAGLPLVRHIGPNTIGREEKLLKSTTRPDVSRILYYEWSANYALNIIYRNNTYIIVGWILYFNVSASRFFLSFCSGQKEVLI